MNTLQFIFLLARLSKGYYRIGGDFGCVYYSFIPSLYFFKFLFVSLVGEI